MEHPVNPKPLRIAVIGAGEMSTKTHMPIMKALAEKGVYMLQAVCDLNFAAAVRAQKQFGFVHAIQNVDDLFALDFDALYIFGTIDMHYEFGLRALEAGKHIFIEKPPAPSLTAFQQLIVAADTHGCVAVVGLNRRFQRALAYVKQEITATGLFAMEAAFHNPFGESKPTHGAKTWLSISAIHAIDTLLFMKGSLPQSIETASNSVTTTEPENFSVLMKWADGMHATLASDNSAGARLGRYVFHGRNVSYFCEHPKFVRAKAGVKEEINLLDADDERGLRGRGYEEEHEAFAKAILNGEKPVHVLERCEETVYLTELIENGFSGEVLPLPALVHVERLAVPVSIDSTILVLNPDEVKHMLPLLSHEHALMFQENSANMSEDDRKKVRAIVTGSGVRIPENAHTLFPNLAVVGIIGASVKKYGVEALLNKGIPIFNTADVYADSVAEFIVMQALVGVRKASRSHDAMRAGGWGVTAPSAGAKMLAYARKMSAYPLLAPVKKIARPLMRTFVSGPISAISDHAVTQTCDLRGTLIGIVGYGEITKKVVPLFRAFGCEVKIFSEHATDEEVRALGALKCDLSEVLACRIVSLQRGLSQTTIDSFGEHEFNAMKKGAIFVNTARAGIVNEAALMRALKRGDIFACLDVFHEEPLSPRSALRTLPNVFLTSHLAASSDQVKSESAEGIIRKVTSFLRGEEVEGVVIDKDRFNSMT